MQFFDDKEEVLDLIVTPFGRHLLSIGRFNPEYYAFFDDDILYDSEWAGVQGEIQNEIETRIQDETPRIKQPSAYTGIETSINANTELILDALETAGFGPAGTGPAGTKYLNVAQDTYNTSIYNQEALQRFGDTYEFLSSPLGSSELSSEYLPTWNVSMLKGQISGSENYLAIAKQGGPADTVKYIYEQIPQLNLTLTYEVYVDSTDSPIMTTNTPTANYSQAGFLIPGSADHEAQPWPEGDIQYPGDPDQIATNAFENIASQIFPDGTYFRLTDGKVVLQIAENNTMYKKENFEIQVFLSSSATADQPGTLELLNFADDETSAYTGLTVGTYLTLNVDKEIHDSTLKSLVSQGLGAIRSGELVTDASTTNVISTREFLIRDLYVPEEEVCD